MLHSAMPLFTNHLQLPLFTGQRRWHTMFGQLSQLTSRGCAGTAALGADEDVLADSNFASLFESSAEQMNSEDAPYMCHRSHASHMATQGCPTLAIPQVTDLIESSLSALDENVHDVQSSAEHSMVDANVRQSDDNANCDSEPVTVTDARLSCELTVNVNRNSREPGGEHEVQCVGSHSASSGSQSRMLCGRRHSDPGSIHSSTNGSLSVSSNSEDWYYYDRRLRPGGELAALYGRLRTRRSLSVILFPPAYDDIVCNAPASSPSVVQHAANPLSELTVSDSAGDQLTELPPPYHESERPPSYSEITDAAGVNEPLDNAVSQAVSTAHEYVNEPLDNALSTAHAYSQLSSAENCGGSNDADVLLRGCSQSHRMFVGRPAVRWNRNTRIERWTSSSFNWVMS